MNDVTPVTGASPRPRRRRHRTLRRVLLGLLVLVLVVLGGGYLYAKPLLFTATGYAAHNDCAVRAVAGRSDPMADLPPNPLVPYLRTQQDGTTTTASVLGVIARQTATSTTAYGCTLGGTPAGAEPPTAVPADAARYVGPVRTPTGQTGAAIAAAFGDDLSAAEQSRLGTRAVVVLRKGVLVGERYAPGFTADTPQLGWSMGKSVANLLTGRVVAAGKVSIGDAKLRPEWTDDRARITVEDLMRMTSGLTWDETYDLGTPITSMLYLEPDMGAYAASLPLAHPVGTFQQYSSGSTNLLCSVLHDRTGIGADLPRRELFAPLGLTSAVWEPDAAGTPVCSSYLWATPRDWATLGQFALQDGVWGGQRLLPEGWMRESVTAKAVSATEEDGYAAGWWVNRRADGSLVDATLPADTYWMQGHDGQRVYVVPSAELVVVRLGFSPSVAAGDLRTAALVTALVTALVANR